MATTRQYITKSATETAKVGQRLAASRKRIVCLYGDLGSGKTTFTQGYAKAIGVTQRLLSPTFIIVRRYDLPENFLFYHIDLYRMKMDDDLQELGLPEIFSDPMAFVVIEWADRLGELLPQARTDIYFTLLPDETHKIVTV